MRASDGLAADVGIGVYLVDHIVVDRISVLDVGHNAAGRVISIVVAGFKKVMLVQLGRVLRREKSLKIFFMNIRRAIGNSLFKF